MCHKRGQNEEYELDDGSLGATEGFQMAGQELGISDAHLLGIVNRNTGERFHRHALSLCNRGSRTLPPRGVG